MSVELTCRPKHTPPAAEPLHGAAALEADLIAAINSALDAVLADDRRRPGATASR